MAVLGLSGHLLSRYIVHLGLKNTPGLIFEVPGPQNPVKKLILSAFSKIRRRFSGRAAGQVCKATFILVFFLSVWPGRPKIFAFLATMGYSLALLDIPEAESDPP